MMKVDFNRPLVSLKNVPLKERVQNDEGGFTEGLLTLKSICINALLAVIKNENVSGNEKFARFELAKKISSVDSVELKAEEITKLKQLVGKAYGPIVVGRAYELLEGKSDGTEPE